MKITPLLPLAVLWVALASPQAFASVEELTTTLASPTRLTTVSAPRPPSVALDAESPDEDRLAPETGPVTAEYLIVTARPLVGPFARFAAWKRRHGVTAEVRTLSWVRRRYPNGVDDAERIRLAIREAYQRGTRWVLLGGDTEVIPTRYVHATEVLGPRDYESDYYFACLDGNWNADGDGYFGEGRTNTEHGDEADLVPEVYVGRAPVRTAREARNFIEKTIAYEEGWAGPSAEQTLFFAEVLVPKPWTGGIAQVDLASIVEGLLLQLPELDAVRLYENHADPRYQPGALHEDQASVLAHLAAGYPLSVFVGGGSATAMSVGADLLTPDEVLELDEPKSLTNLVAISSWTHAIGQDCIAEAFLRSRGGAVTSMGSSTQTFLGVDGVHMREYLALAMEDSTLAVGELATRHKLGSLVSAEVDGPFHDYVLSVLLLGDPQLHLKPRPIKAKRPHRRGTVAEAAKTNAFEWSGPWPNPARDRVSFTLDAAPDPATKFEITIFDLAGRRVRRIEQASTSGGHLAAEWDLRDETGKRINEGVYFVSARIGTARQVRRLLVVH